MLSGFRPLEWTEYALCSQVDPELFFPEKGNPAYKAKAVCAACPVMMQCRSYAINSPVFLYGVWGGLSERDRRYHRSKGQLPLRPSQDPKPEGELCGTEAGAKRHYRRGERPCLACLRGQRWRHEERLRRNG